MIKKFRICCDIEIDICIYEDVSWKRGLNHDNSFLKFLNIAKNCRVLSDKNVFLINIYSKKQQLSANCNFSATFGKFKMIKTFWPTLVKRIRTQEKPLFLSKCNANKHTHLRYIWFIYHLLPCKLQTHSLFKFNDFFAKFHID